MINRYASLRQGLVGAWCPSLGASGFRLIDRSGNNNHGTLTNMDPGTDWQTSGGKLALDFDGSNDYVLVNSINLYVVHTTSTWFYGETIPSTYNVNALFGEAGSSNTCPIMLDASSIYYSMGTGGAKTALSYNLRFWRHLCSVRNGADVYFYADGNFIGSGVVPTSTTPFSLARIGARQLIAGLYANGRIDDVRIYNRVLTAQEISLLYTGGRGVGLVPERIKHRRRTTAAATNRRRRIICGANC